MSSHDTAPQMERWRTYYWRLVLFFKIRLVTFNLTLKVQWNYVLYLTLFSSSLKVIFLYLRNTELITIQQSSGTWSVRKCFLRRRLCKLCISDLMFLTLFLVKCLGVSPCGIYIPFVSLTAGDANIYQQRCHFVKATTWKKLTSRHFLLQINFSCTHYEYRFIGKR